jgi:phosphoribosylanthranilate isomerase
VDKLLIDSSVKGVKGGTGISFNWDILKELSLGIPFVLAGGINSENVQEAIRLVNPQVVDVSSSVEENGIKSFEKIKEFIEKVGKCNERQIW